MCWRDTGFLWRFKQASIAQGMTGVARRTNAIHTTWMPIQESFRRFQTKSSCGHTVQCHSNNTSNVLHPEELQIHHHTFSFVLLYSDQDTVVQHPNCEEFKIKIKAQSLITGQSTIKVYSREQKWVREGLQEEPRRGHKGSLSTQMIHLSKPPISGQAPSP